jgi:hypothetical protein
VRQQEGRRWYDEEVQLGIEHGEPIVAITNRVVLANLCRPSDAYLRTIALGLKEMFEFDDDQVVAYLLEKEGVKGRFRHQELLSAISWP